ncbi:MAG TPA: S1 RNA-binding domain-containing protein [Myxococcales bacterium]
MADETPGGGGKRGGNKPFPKTFGDVMKGIPAGKGGEPKREGASPEKHAGGERHDKRDKRRRPEEPKKGPVVVRKPPPLGAKPAESAAGEKPAEGMAGEKPAEGAVAAPAVAAAPHAHETHHRTEPRKTPKTVFRRADGLNLPPREAEGEKALAPAEPSGPPGPEENFAELFAASQAAATPKRFEVGQKVSGRIVQIGHEQAFLDLGGKGEAMIDLAELKDSHGNLIVALGEILEAYVLATGGGIVVTKQLSKGAQRDFLDEACHSGIPVEGLVTGFNKGGLEIDLGGIRGFCPASQVDVRRVEDLSTLVGQRYLFKVIELKDTDVVLSRRGQLEAEGQKKAAELRETLHVGLQLEGTVTSVRDFGAFVDLGGIEGMVHVSEMGYSRVAHPKDVLAPGQKVMVEVVRIDAAKEGEKHERIGLSMKALQQDPWQQAAAQLHEGDRIKGKVVRLQPFGAFVEILPGVDGLVHISALGAPKRIAHPSEVVKEGDEVECVVEAIDASSKRVSLRRITGDEPAAEAGPAKTVRDLSPGAPPKVGDLVDATVDKVEPFGLFVRFKNGRGLIPNVEMGTPKGADHRKMFPPGTVFKAAIIEIDGTGRLKLSKAGAEQAQERAEYREFMKEHQKGAPGGKGFGTLGDMLKNLKK